MMKRKRSIDMLSGLLDEILHHILSFLPTKISVRTSVLAKRWRFLWAHVPNLRFHGNNFRVGSETQPLDTICRVAMLHQAVILNTFQLSKLKGCSSYQLDTLVIYLTKRNLRNLHLDFGFGYRDDIACTLPRLLFTCKTLVNLRLVSCGVIPSTGEMFLPSLKKLNLSCVEYEDDESLPHLLSGCPVLEELIAEVCYREGQKNSSCVIVSSPTIKTLAIEFSNVCSAWPDEKLIIDVPALLYLKVDYFNLLSIKSLEKTMTSLIEANFTLNRDCHVCTGTDCMGLGPWVEFLSCLCHVRYLKISNHSDETTLHFVGTGSMTKFVNLTKLQLVLPVKWYNVVKFLEAADNLEVLIISIVETLPFTEPKRVPPCMLSRLRTVTLSYFDACEEGYFTVVRYVLRNAQVLERMEIHAYGSTDKENLDTLRRISLFERGSKLCQLDFNTLNSALSNSSSHAR